jgi:hypothetical protein
MNISSVRGLAIGAVVAGGAFAVSLTGIGYAANGGAFLLGHGNAETRTASLNNSAGTPLSLVAPATKAPLKVSNSVKVARLNADLLDGLHASAFQKAGAIVRVSAPTYSPSEGPINRQARAYCVSGEHAVAGGAHVVATTDDRLGEYYNFLVHSAPITSATGEPVADGAVADGWLVESTNVAHAMSGLTGRDANLYAYVVCEKN